MYEQKKNTYRPSLFLLFFLSLLSCTKHDAFLYPPKPQVTIRAGDQRLSGKLIHFAKDTVYIIASNLSIDSGKLFSLDPGALVKVNRDLKITIRPGARIEAKGTGTSPVVFTLNEPKGNPGVSNIVNTKVWAGLTILGNLNGNSSGILSHVRIEFAGASYNSALLLSGVSKATILNNIQVSYCLENAFDFEGGDCNAGNLASYVSSGTDFYIGNGYKGNLQNLLAFRDPELATTSQVLAGMYIGGNGTSPVISNLTIMRPGLKNGVNGNYSLGDPYKRAAIIAADGCNFHIRNSVVIGIPTQRNPQVISETDSTSVRAFYLQSYGSAASLDSGKSELSYSIFYQANGNTFYLSPNSYKNYTSANLQDLLLRDQFHNDVFTGLSQFNLEDPYSYNYYFGIFNPAPASGSPLSSGADFNSTVYSDPFFIKTNYRGALGLGNDNWLRGWVNFIPLQTDYNN